MNIFLNINEFYNVVFEKLNICFFTYDVVNRRIIVPEKTRKILQCRGIYENMPVSFADDFVADEYRERFFQFYEDCNNGQENCECVFEDKHKRFFLCVKLLVTQRDGHGKPMTAIGIIDNQMDIKKLLQKQNRYINAILSSCVGYIEINLNRDEVVGNVINLRAESCFSPVADEISAHVENGYDEFERWWSENMLVTDKEEFLQVCNCKYLLSCFEEGIHVVDVLYSSVVDPGNVIDNKQTYYLSKDGSSGDIIATCVVYDLTEQHEKERDMYHKNLVIQKLCDKFDSICYVNLDQGTMIDYCVDQVWDSRRNEKKEPFRYVERMEQYADSFVLEEDREKYKKYMSPEVIKSRLQNESTCIFDYRVLDGEEIHYYSARMVKDDSSKKDFSVIIGVRNLDAAMHQHKLLEETLRYAEHASRVKLNFLSNMSHDMRTPMNAIIGFSTLAATNLDDKEKVKGYLQKIAASGTHLLSLINDFLDMNRIESGKVVLNESEESLAEILLDLRDTLQPQIDEKHMDFFIDTCDVRDELIYCDKMRLKQVLLNIFGNAVKYTAPGGTITVRIVQKDKLQRDCGNFEFHIKDNGKGMSKEFLKHVFEPFAREDQYNSDVNPGTGLGLSIAKNIVEMMNGTIEVKSELGKGSEFIVSLTFKLQKKPVENDSGKGESLQELAVDKGSHTREKQKKPVHMDFSEKKVLLVEDIEINQEIANEILTEKGFEVFIADNGRIALDMIKQAKQGDYDIILMDIRMPEMDGYEATKAIRQMDSEYRNIPIVAMTANAFEDDRQMSFRVGMNEHIAKPLDEEHLFMVLWDLLS